MTVYRIVSIKLFVPSTRGMCPVGVIIFFLLGISSSIAFKTVLSKSWPYFLKDPLARNKVRLVALKYRDAGTNTHATKIANCPIVFTGVFMMHGPMATPRSVVGSRAGITEQGGHFPLILHSHGRQRIGMYASHEDHDSLTRCKLQVCG